MNKINNLTGLDGQSFMQENEISIWVTKFTDASLVHFYEKFSKLESDPSVGVILIYISSYGGSAHNMSAMRDLIKSSSKPVATVCIGKAFSSGAMLLAAGTKGLRFITESGQIMVHQASSFSQGKASDVFASAMNLSHINDLVLRNFAQDIGMKESDLKQMIRENDNVDLFLNPKECLELGIVDRIDIPRIAIQHGHMSISVKQLEEVEPLKASPKKKAKKK